MRGVVWFGIGFRIWFGLERDCVYVFFYVWMVDLVGNWVMIITGESRFAIWAVLLVVWLVREM